MKNSCLNSIETCGETITQQINECSRKMVIQLIEVVERNMMYGELQPQQEFAIMKSFNDIKVLLNNQFTKEYVIESLR
jgi:hypothetical protein